jgi:hypothetical protein
MLLGLIVNDPKSFAFPGQSCAPQNQMLMRTESLLWEFTHANTWWASRVVNLHLFFDAHKSALVFSASMPQKAVGRAPPNQGGIQNDWPYVIVLSKRSPSDGRPSPEGNQIPNQITCQCFCS